MIKILFVCHGNICRSPMAEFIMKNLVKSAGREKDFYIESAACRTDEIGNDMYPPAKRKLTEKGIPFERRAARLVRNADIEKFDFIICMDDENLYDLARRFGREPLNSGKIKKLPEYFGEKRDVDDPWYSGDFEATYSDIVKGCREMLKII